MTNHEHGDLGYHPSCPICAEEALNFDVAKFKELVNRCREFIDPTMTTPSDREREALLADIRKAGV